MPQKTKIWPRNPALLSGWEFASNNALARKLSQRGYQAIVEGYTYVDRDSILEVFSLVPDATESLVGVGCDLGSGAGIVSSAIATLDSVTQIYSLEFVDNCVELCMPIVFEEISEATSQKITPILGDFDQLQFDEASLDFCVMWDSLHHARDPVATLSGVSRALKQGARLVVVDRAHDNCTKGSVIDAWLNVEYDMEFKRKNAMPANRTITRRMNGENEYRITEIERFFSAAGLRIISGTAVSSDQSLKKNDADYPELFFLTDLGGFVKKKFIFVLEKMTEPNFE